MASADVYVSFGADTGGLEAAMAIAKADVTAMTAELRKLAREMQSTGAAADSELGNRVLAAGTSLATAKAHATEIKDELAVLSGSAFTEVGAAAERGLAGVEISAHEVGHAVHGLIELMRGETGRAERGFISLAVSIAAANPGLIGLGAGALAAGGAFGYLAYEAYEGATAVESIKAAAIVDQLSMTDAEAIKLRDSIKQLAGVSSSAAAEIARPFLAASQGGAQLAEMVSAYLPALAAGLGTTVPEEAKKLAEAFDDLKGKGRELVVGTKGVSAATIESYDAFVASGETVKAQAMIWDALRARLEESRAAAVAEGAATSAGNIARGAALGSVAALSGAQQAQAAVVAAATEKYNSAVAALDSLKAAFLSAAPAADAFSRALETALKLDKVGTEIAKTTGEIKQMQDALGQATAKGDATGAAALQAGLERADDSLKKLQQQASDGLLGRDLVAQTREQIAAFDATFKGSTVDRLQDERAMLAQLAAGAQLSAQQRHQAELDLAAKDKEVRDAAYRAFAAGEDEQATAAALNKAKVIAIREDELRETIAIYGRGSDQAIAAEQKVAQAKSAAAKQGVATVRQGAETEAQGEIQAAQRTAKTIEDELDERLKMHKITMAEWVADTEAALATESAAVRAAYQSELQTAGLTSAEIKAIKNKEAEELGKIAQQEMHAEAKAAEQSAQAWKSAADQFAGIINSQISGVLRGTTSVAQAFKNMAASALEDIIKLCVTWVAEQAAAVAANVLGLGAGATTSAAAAKPGILASIQADVGQAFAGFSAFFAPMLGPAAPGAAAGLAGGVQATAMSLAALDVGGYVLSSGLAVIHAGETVTPARVATPYAGAGQGGHSISVAPTMHFHNSPYDDSGFQRLLSGNGGGLMKAVDRAVRDGAHLGLRGLRR